ncbi:MAG: hypothetical protein JO356_04390 [Acidobacteria bacterium]|nr:hypothetical protein [Acidobacteriota bacterium]
MTYIKCKWNHTHPDDPILLYSELDDERRESRKIEIFRDGKKGFADSDTEFGGSSLGLEPVPPLNEIAADYQFEPEVITKAEFELVWSEATQRARMSDGYGHYRS